MNEFNNGERRGFANEKHKALVQSLLSQPGGWEKKLFDLYTGGEEEVREGIERMRELDEEDWESLRWQTGPNPLDEFKVLGKTNARLAGHPEWEGKPKFEYHPGDLVLDEFSFVIICNDESGDDIQTILPAVGGNIVKGFAD